MWGAQIGPQQPKGGAGLIELFQHLSLVSVVAPNELPLPGGRARPARVRADDGDGDESQRRVGTTSPHTLRPRRKFWRCPLDGDSRSVSVWKRNPLLSLARSVCRSTTSWDSLACHTTVHATPQRDAGCTEFRAQTRAVHSALWQGLTLIMGLGRKGKKRKLEKVETTLLLEDKTEGQRWTRQRAAYIIMRTKEGTHKQSDQMIRFIKHLVTHNNTNQGEFI